MNINTKMIECLSNITNLSLIELVNTLSSLNEFNRVYINPINDIVYYDGNDNQNPYHGMGVIIHAECNSINICIDIVKPINELLDINKNELFILHVYEEVCSLLGSFKYTTEKLTTNEFFLYYVMDESRCCDKGSHDVFYIIGHDIENFNEDDFKYEAERM